MIRMVVWRSKSDTLCRQYQQDCNTLHDDEELILIILRNYFCVLGVMKLENNWPVGSGEFISRAE